MTIIMALWFIMAGQVGYIAPLDITPAACGLPTRVDKLAPDREVNPRVVRWADCAVDVRATVAALPAGQYHLAATGFGSYVAPDPHTSGSFVISPDFEPPAEEQTPVTANLRFSWTQEDALAIAEGFRYELELDGVLLTAPLVASCVASPANALFSLCSAPSPVSMTKGLHRARIRTVDDDLPDLNDWLFSDYSTEVAFDLRGKPGSPKGVTVVQIK